MPDSGFGSSTRSAGESMADTQQSGQMQGQHQQHTGDHGHVHNEMCGHESRKHGDHSDYEHDGHWHAKHGEHYDEHDTSMSGQAM
jgi:hypothetical protein